ncbi:MAG: hypothetical protein AB7F31_07460 [Parachlamydiales bacterium]
MHGRILEDIDALRIAMDEFVKRYNNDWLAQKLGYKSPAEARQAWNEKMVA